MSVTQKNGNEPSPAQELENLVEDVAGYDCAYEQAKTKREAAEKALQLAKAEEEFEANKLRAILAAVRTKSASDARVYDQHLRTCLGKMKTTRDGQWNSKTRRYGQTPKPGVTKWSELARTGAADEQIVSNLKNGFDSYGGVKSGLYQLKGMQFKSILGTDDMGREKGATVLDQKQLLAAIRRVMKIGNPKPKAPPPAKKPEPTKPAAAAAKKAPETKAAAKRTAPATATTSKVKASPAPPPAKLTNVRIVDHDRSPEQKHAKKMLAKARAAIDANPEPPDQPGVGEQALRQATFSTSEGQERLQTFLRNHKGEPSDAEIGAFLGKAFGISGGFGVWSWSGGARPVLNTGIAEWKGAGLIDLFRQTFLKNWPLPDPPAPPNDWMTFVEDVRRLSLGQLELHEGPVRPELWKFFQEQWNAGSKPVQAVERWHEREMDEAKKKTDPAPTLKLSPHNISVGKLDPALFDSGTGVPDQPQHQKLSWEQWAHAVRTCQDARSCKDWPQTSSNIPALRQPLVDKEDKAVRAAYLAGRKPAAAARELAQMFAKRASRADRSRSTLSDAEEKSLRGEKVGAA